MGRFRRLYGASPLHLLALAASMAIAAAAVAGWFASFPGPTVVKILEWFAAAVIVHDLVLLPLYTLLDRIAFGAVRARRAPPPAGGSGSWCICAFLSCSAGCCSWSSFPRSCGSATARSSSRAAFTSACS